MIDQTVIRESIRAALIEDDTLADAGVFHRLAPQGAQPPYVIFFKQSGLDVHTFDPEDFYVNQLWLIKGVSRGGDSARAEAIDARCRVALTPPVLINGAEMTTRMTRESDVDYGHVDEGGVQIHHVGGSYRLEVQ